MGSHPAPSAARSEKLGLGVHVGQQNATMPELTGLFRRFDDHVDWISVWDHLYEAPPAGGTTPHFEAIATLGALAAVTEKARLGCLMFCVPYRNPALLAKACVAIDHISGGRFEPGFGAGWHEPEFRAHGYGFPPLGSRFDMVDEALTIISSMLSSETTTFAGEHYAVEEVRCVPGPVGGSLPLWTGGRGPRRTPAVAARFCSGWNVPYVDAAEYRRLNASLDETCESIGRDPGSLERSINLAFHMGADSASATRERQRIVDQWGTEMSERVFGGAITGTPDEALEQIERFRRAGADIVNVALRLPVDDDALEAYLTEVVPAARSEID